MIAKDKIAYGSERDKIKIMGSLDLDFGPGSDPFDPPPAVTLTITYGDPTETIFLEIIDIYLLKLSETIL